MTTPYEVGPPNRLAELRFDQIEAYLQHSDVALVPVGATEQHGRHLPLGVDAMTAIAVAESASAETGVVVAPPAWYGWSPHHMGFAGTITVRPETLTMLAEDIATSLIHHGFRRIIFVNGHRLANLPPLSIAVTRVRAATGAVVVLADLAHLAQPEYEKWQREDGTIIGHADGYETAHMQYLHPRLVAADAIPETEGPVGSTDSLRIIDPSIASSRAAWWPSTEDEILATGDGTSGTPSWATPDRGETLHRAMVRDLVKLVHQVRDTPAEVRTPDAPR